MNSETPSESVLKLVVVAKSEIIRLTQQIQNLNNKI